MQEYEVHEIYDNSDEPLSVETYEYYEEAEEAYNKLIADGKFARLLVIDDIGIYEIIANC